MKKTIVKYSVTLFLITLSVAILLSYVNLLTRDKIAKISAKEAETARLEVVKSISYDDIITTDYDNLWIAKSNEAVKGYIVNEKSQGYGGEIDIYVGMDNSFNITGVKIISMSETAGLGTNAQSDSFLSQFIGKSKGVTYSKKTPDSNEIQALTGATVTTNAVCMGVANAIELASEVAAEEGQK
ncbi:MAG: FMN-binding protein [Eubacteriales bacterium]|nr:FMN-binding protein [Eubacteriales bacterium]